MSPQLVYASSIWYPHTQSNINQIEAVQQTAARFVTWDYRRTSSVLSMLEHLGCENHHTHRQHGKMVLIYRIVNHLVEIPALLFRLSWRMRRVAQSVGHLTHKSEVLGLIPGLATYFCFSFRGFKRGSCQLLVKVCARSTA